MSAASEDLLLGAALIKQIERGESTDPKGDFSKSTNLIKNAVTLIMNAQAQGQIPKELNSKIENLEPFIDLFSNSTQLLSEILGFEKEMTYLILFQDNTHLRPSGGVIKSFGILKIKDGKVLPFSINDSATIDNALERSVEAPFPIRRYTLSRELFFKDSGFSPDFLESAEVVTSIYSLAKKEQIDGVIGADYEFAKNITDAINGEASSNRGKIYNPALEKDVSRAVANTLISGVKTKKDISYLRIAEMIGKSIKEKHLLFAFGSSSIQNVFSVNGWSGSLWDRREEGGGKINDYIGINEANLGGGNINLDISRSVSKKVRVLDDGEITSTVTISYKNSSRKEGTPGTYKNYMQVLVPKGSEISSIAIDGREQEIEEAVTNPGIYEAKSFRPPQGIEVYEKIEGVKSNFGFLINVEGGKTKTVSLTFVLPGKISKSQKDINYSLKIYKQPGVSSFPLDLTFDLPKNFEIVGKDKHLDLEIAGDGQVSFLISQK